MTDIYQTTKNKEKTQAELATSAKALIDNDIDMIICEVIFDSTIYRVKNKVERFEVSRDFKNIM